MTTTAESEMAKPKGRPKKSERDDITVKLDRTVVGKAKLIATHRGVPVAELLTELVSVPVDRAYMQMLKDLEKKRMRIYKVERTDGNIGYDEYDAFIVVAEDETEAAKFHPNGEEYDPGPSSLSWPVGTGCPGTLSIKLIGEAAPGVERGVVLASFNAG